MKKLKDSRGSTLVEVITAVAIFTVMASTIVVMLYTSKNVTDKNLEMRINYENSVGTMDGRLQNSANSADDPTSITNSDTSVAVTFPAGASSNVDCVQSVNNNYSDIGIVKAK